MILQNEMNSFNAEGLKLGERALMSGGLMRECALNTQKKIGLLVDQRAKVRKVGAPWAAAFEKQNELAKELET